MIKIKSPLKLFTRAISLAGLLITSTGLYAQTNAPDPFLLQAFEGVWKMERSATTLITERVDTQVDDGILRHEPQAKDAPVYLRESYEIGEIEYRRKKYSATQSQWGSFPQLNPDTMRLIEISIPQTKYLVLSGQGENLFSATDWQRYRFLHVFDMGRSRYITNYYPVFAEAFLGERVLGRLPNSQVLNYARVVPARWDANNTISGYEVLLYNLDRKGITRTLENEVPVAYQLNKNPEGPLWTLTPVTATPVADELDRKGHFFTGARLSSDEFKARQLAAQEAQQNSKKNKRKSGTKTAKPVSQR
ncbi:hypothetical protein D0C16_12650 [Cellvibrio sp. KY-GH-1]|uniref:hypothetical protein n=1 Tax=Cellvibrio sp. KY-GH-1 TaxID=2303332 RepID=UPI001246E96E|nr:hypothetical protein [Cellvibrio sp. KY-GH-1]QEY16743.1 hypothetical protein D0C16_12650 [Cellvibrio sp. KY-GH-1]